MLTTDAKQYYPSGQIASHITYKQKTKRTGQWFSENQEDEAVSYIASIMQYSETGKVQVSAQLSEYDEISFNGDNIGCRRNGGHNVAPYSRTIRSVDNFL